MNIFVVHKDPLEAAFMLCDQHILSQFKESIQMMVAAALFNGVAPARMPLTLAGTHHRGGYKHHPCTVWVSESRENYGWLLLHTVGLAQELNNRYGNTDSILHKQLRTLWVQSAEIQAHFPDIPMTPFARAMNQSKGENLDLIDDEQYTTVDAYREYYRRDKKSFAKWIRGTPAPPWFHL